jgi:hypothetical protein
MSALFPALTASIPREMLITPSVMPIRLRA